MENKRVESALKQAVHQRNYRRARDRALTRLANLYPGKYKELLQEEKKRDELEDKKWTSIADSPVFGVDYDPPRRRNAPTRARGKRGRPRRAKATRNNGGKA
jgi:hypothetical protein